MNLDNAIGIVVAVAVLVYLTFTLIRPERF